MKFIKFKTIIFSICIIIINITIGGFINIANVAGAQETPKNIKLLVPIPLPNCPDPNIEGVTCVNKKITEVKDFSSLAVVFYEFGIIVIAVILVFFGIIGGLIYMTSAGNKGRAEKGLSYIKNTFYALLLLLFSYVLLYTINPKLTDLSITGVSKIERIKTCEDEKEKKSCSKNTACYWVTNGSGSAPSTAAPVAPVDQNSGQEASFGEQIGNEVVDKILNQNSEFSGENLREALYPVQETTTPSSAAATTPSAATKNKEYCVTKGRYECEKLKDKQNCNGIEIGCVWVGEGSTGKCVQGRDENQGSCEAFTSAFSCSQGSGCTWEPGCSIKKSYEGLLLSTSNPCVSNYQQTSCENKTECQWYDKGSCIETSKAFEVDCNNFGEDACKRKAACYFKQNNCVFAPNIGAKCDSHEDCSIAQYCDKDSETCKQKLGQNEYCNELGKGTDDEVCMAGYFCFDMAVHGLNTCMSCEVRHNFKESQDTVYCDRFRN